MPLYEYECEACGKRFEIIQKFSDSPADVCKVCGKGPVRRLLSSPAIQFKGSGWYITDYSQKGKSSDSSSASSKDDKGSKESTDSKGAAAAKSDSAGSGDSSAKPASSATSKSDAS